MARSIFFLNTHHELKFWFLRLVSCKITQIIISKNWQYKTSPIFLSLVFFRSYIISLAESMACYTFIWYLLKYYIEIKPPCKFSFVKMVKVDELNVKITFAPLNNFTQSCSHSLCRMQNTFFFHYMNQGPVRHSLWCCSVWFAISITNVGLVS